MRILLINVLNLLMCHFVGDYVLQSRFIAETKGTNIWHLVVHSFLYSLPFYIVFGLCWQLYVVIFSHMIIDSLKARFYKINYLQDQILHLIICSLYLIGV